MRFGPALRLVVSLVVSLILPGFGVVGGAGCVGPLFGDGSSVSIGTPGRGTLRRGALLPPEGDGYVVPPTWRNRGASYGTDELVEALVRAAREVRWRHPGSLLSIADLSHRGGGISREHRSHHSGRDVDVLFYAVDDQGRPAPPADVMPRYDRGGRMLPPHPGRPDDPAPDPGWPLTGRRFDARRTWAFLRSLLTDPAVEVQWVFIHDRLKQLLLDEGRAEQDDPELLARADQILHQPGDSRSHDDHMHIRIYCAPDDRLFGCNDRGPQRWLKKHFKYGLYARTDPEAGDRMWRSIRTLLPGYPR